MFLETPPFPACPSYGAQGAPRYSVTILPTGSGRERRTRNWQRSLVQFDCTVGPRAEEIVQEILEFWHAMGGRECGFRFLDYTDYKSCQVQLDVTAEDQGMNAINGSQFQLVKVYTRGVRSQVRNILKPISGTILIAISGVTKTEGVDYTIDYTKGIVTFGSTPDPTLVTWGGEFHVPVRFNSEFPIQIIEHEIESVQFSLHELRDPFDGTPAAQLLFGHGTLHFTQTGNCVRFNINGRSGSAAITFSGTGNVTNASGGPGTFNFVSVIPPLTSPPSSSGFFFGGIAADGSGNVLLMESNTPAMMISTDGGQTFNTGSQTLPGGAASGPMFAQGSVWLAGDGSTGVVWRSTDVGVTWASHACFSNVAFEVATGFSGDGTNLVAVGNSGSTAVSTDGGITWTEHNGIGSIIQWTGNFPFSAFSDSFIRGNSEYAAIGYDGTDYQLGTSTDMVTWSFTNVGANSPSCIDWDGALYACCYPNTTGHVTARFASTFAGLASATDISVDTASGINPVGATVVTHDRHGIWGVFSLGSEVAFSTTPASAPSWQAGDAGYGGSSSSRAVVVVYDSFHDELVGVNNFSGGIITTRP